MKRRICFVTGSRAEFGLMQTTLRAIADHPALQLQLIATGMHLSRAHGYSLAEIRRSGWKVDATVPWAPQTASPTKTAAATGKAIERLALAFEKLKTDVVLVVGDRVEAFAAAAAGHVSQRIIAHVHGGDRAQGQVDDAVRHAITKLSHIHFAATKDSAARLLKLGEHRSSIHVVGTPGIDQVKRLAAPWQAMKGRLEDLQRRQYALVVHHPVCADARAEYQTANEIATALRRARIERAVFVHPNNDPGWRGIAQCWHEVCDGERWHFIADAPRSVYLGLLANAAFLIGNSSSGVLEAASFRTWAINVGPRQTGRQHSANQVDVAGNVASILKGLGRILRGNTPRAYTGGNVYGKSGAGRRIALLLADLPPDQQLLRKLISY